MNNFAKLELISIVNKIKLFNFININNNITFMSLCL